MTLSVRVLLMAILGLSLWFVFDGVRCLQTGAYAGRELSPAQAMEAPGVVVELGDGRFVEYGTWAKPLVALGVHPNDAAPFFVGLGLFGFFALVAFLFRKGPLGWAGLVAFCVVSLAYAWLGTALAGLALVMLALPSTRRRAFGVDG